MEENWFEEFHLIVEDDKKRKKKRRLTSIVGLIFYILSMPVLLVGAVNYNIFIALLGVSFLPLAILFLIYSLIAGRVKQFIFPEDKIIYDLKSLTHLIENYQKTKVESAKKELYTQIIDKLRDLESITFSIAHDSKKYIDSEYDEKSNEYYNRIINTLYYAIENDKKIKDELLSSIDEYCDKRIELRKKYELENLELKDKILDKAAKFFKVKEENLYEKRSFNIFQNTTFFTQILFLIILITVGVVLLFGFLLPGIANYDSNTLLICAVTIWGATFGPGTTILWFKNKEPK